MSVLRKLLAITLLAILGLPFATSLFALTPKSEANVPACCRRNGKHHCMMSMSQRAELSSPGMQLRAPLERCPYCPASLVTAGHQLAAVPVGSRVLSLLTATSTLDVRVERRSMLFRDRSHPKRGPPQLLSL